MTLKKGIELDDLLEQVSTYMPKSDVDEIKKCYEYVKHIHFGEKRLTGEDFIYHLLNVAYILTDIKADKDTICAALLHEAIDKEKITYDEIKEKFGDSIAELVEGVTKINRLNFNVTSPSSIAAQRKIFVGLCEDVRVIIIKLADRIHNMRTLWVHPIDVQKEKAKENLEILIPIAHRLGVNSYKSELEDLSLRYLKPEIYFDIVDRLNQTKAERDLAVETMKKQVSELLNENGIKHEIKGRAKSIYSIYKKLDKGRSFNDIYDLLALRVFVDTKEDCYKALGIIHSKYRPVPKRLKDFIAMPKANLYQSLHTTVFGLDDMFFEIQIRTYEMDEIAERGGASHWSYKEGTNGNNKNFMDQKLQFFRSIIELNQETITDEEFLNTIKEDFQETIYVYTPKGDVIELPQGATPIDFAYKVHSGVGDKMVGAIVNNNIVPLDYELKNEDIIKINTNKNSNPSREWISMAKTTQAKNKIKSYFKKLDKEEYLQAGEELLNHELRKNKIAFNDFLTDENVSKLLNALKLSSMEEVYIGLGNGKITFTHLHDILNEEENEQEKILKKVHTQEVSLKNDIIVDGIDDIKINLAACCKPIPGDRIVGYITKGYGITIHRMMCPNISNGQERTINVKWNYLKDKKYETNVVVRALKSNNILLDIVTKISNVNISSINTYNHENDVLFDLTVMVENKENLDKFINDIKMIPNVIEVNRSIK